MALTTRGLSKLFNRDVAKTCEYNANVYYIHFDRECANKYDCIEIYVSANHYTYHSISLFKDYNFVCASDTGGCFYTMNYELLIAEIEYYANDDTN